MPKKMFGPQNVMKSYRFPSQPLLDMPRRKAVDVIIRKTKKPQRMKQYGDPGYEPSNGRGVSY